MVTDRGAGFHIESADIAAFVNVTIADNVAAQRGGGGWCSNSPQPLTLAQCTLTNNTAPVGGGAIHVGVPAFHPSAQCGAQEIIEYAAVNMSTVSFEGNVALDRGGAVHVVAGQLSMDVSGGRKWQLHWLAASL